MTYTTHPNSPDAEDTKPGVYEVTVTVTLWGAYSKEDAAVRVGRMLDSDFTQIEAIKCEFVEPIL